MSSTSTDDLLISGLWSRRNTTKSIGRVWRPRHWSVDSCDRCCEQRVLPCSGSCCARKRSARPERTTRRSDTSYSNWKRTSERSTIGNSSGTTHGWASTVSAAEEERVEWKAGFFSLEVQEVLGRQQSADDLLSLWNATYNVSRPMRDAYSALIDVQNQQAKQNRTSAVTHSHIFSSDRHSLQSDRKSFPTFPFPPKSVGRSNASLFSKGWTTRVIRRPTPKNVALSNRSGKNWNRCIGWSTLISDNRWPNCIRDWWSSINRFLFIWRVEELFCWRERIQVLDLFS